MGPTFRFVFEEAGVETACVQLERWMAARPMTRGAAVAIFGPLHQPDSRVFMLGQVRSGTPDPEDS